MNHGHIKTSRSRKNLRKAAHKEAAKFGFRHRTPRVRPWREVKEEETSVFNKLDRINELKHRADELSERCHYLGRRLALRLDALGVERDLASVALEDELQSLLRACRGEVA